MANREDLLNVLEESMGLGTTIVWNFRKSNHNSGVEAFLNGQIRFTDISLLNARALSRFAGHSALSLEDILALDQESRRYTQTELGSVLL